jgi:hypothetical protein
MKPLIHPFMGPCRSDLRCFRSDRHTGPHAYPDDPASQKRAEEWIRETKRRAAEARDE